MKTLLLGDFSPTNITDPLFKEKKIDTLFTDTLSLFEGNDVNLVNFECAITDSEAIIDKFGPGLRCCEEVAEVLKEVGVRYCALSNNHIFDFGKEGFYNTIRVLSKNGMTLTGYGENELDARKDLVIEKDGEKVAVVNVCEHEYSYALANRCGCRAYDPYDTMEDIRKAKESADRVIVLYHGGKEQCEYPSPRLMKLCRAMVKNGADVVLCQHSHCIGAYEKFEGGHILYGQGNYHFVKPSKNANWYTALAVKYDTKSHEIEFIPLQMLEEGIGLAKGELKKEIVAGFAERSASLADGTWIHGWRAFCESKREDYTKILINAYKEDSSPRQNHKFAHYLDCEAHTDVWRELFKTANHTNELN